MSWQNLLIGTPADLNLERGALLCKQGDTALRLPLDDIATITLESPQIRLTAALLARLNEEGIALISCNAQHIPNGVMLAYNAHSRSADVLRVQLSWSLPLRKRLWQAIVRRKILNQACVLDACNKHSERLHTLARQVQSGDPHNYEAQAARHYFGRLFTNFRRGAGDRRNAALNYGYAILRAAVARDLVRCGFQTALGIQHHSELNAFNLADDLLEPFRPFVDLWAAQEIASDPPTEQDDDDTHRLTRQDRACLTQTLQLGCRIQQRMQRLQHAIYLCVQSLGTALRAGDYRKLSLPLLELPLAIRELD